jgi:dTDP-4-dehydrorhamnose reductase
MYFSTDYVFNGEGERPWKPEDPTGPIGVYGASKLAGEEAVRRILPDRHFILRLQWVYGINGKNFVKTMLNFDKRRKKISVVDDQIGSPTYTADLAPLLVDMIHSENYGIYHATNEGFCSWAEFAEEIFKQADREITVEKIPTSDYPTPAKRPLNSRLSKKSLDDAGFKRLPTWQDAVKRFLAETKKK